MRPEKIELQYFGSYEHETIDFTRFRDHSLFLIAGNTGAGKTTIFDAMCYALFGQTTDEERSATALRSDFAPVDRETKVTFTFNHQGKRYRITRRPKQELAGRQGKKVTHNQAVDLVYPLDSAHPQEITKVREADTFITELLNLTKDQFKQIVLLPQGKFRQFLDANSADKGKLLQDLFNTQRYGKWAESLKTKLREEKKGLDDQENKLGALKENIGDLDASQPTGEWLKAAEKLSDHLADELAKLAAQQAKAQDDVDSANKKVQVAKILQDNLTALKEVKEEAVTLRTKKKAMDQVAVQLADLNWYRDHQEDYHRWVDGEDRRQKLHQEKATITAQLPQLRKEQTQTQQRLQELIDHQQEITAKQVRAQELQTKLPLFKESAHLQKSIADLQHQQATAQKEVSTQQAEITSLQDRLKGLQDQLTVKDELASQRVQLVKRENNYQQVERAAKEYMTVDNDQLADACAQAKLQVALNQYRDVRDKARQHLNDLNDAYARQQIALLARKLKPGTPCPVCGALDHPQPATSIDEPLVSENQVKVAMNKFQQRQEKLSQNLERLQQLKDRQEERVHQLQTRKKELASLLGLASLPVTWRDNVRHLDGEVYELRLALQKREKVVAKASQQEQVTQECLTSQQAALANAQERLNQLNQTLSQQAARLESISDQLPAGMSDLAEVKAKINALNEEADTFNRQLTAVRQQAQKGTQTVAVAQDRLTKLQGDLSQEQVNQDKLHAQLAADLAAYHPELGWEFWQETSQCNQHFATLQDQFQQYQTAVHDNQAQQGRLERVIAGQPAPNLAKLQDELQAAQEALANYQQASGRLTGQCQQVERVRKQVAKLAKQSQQQYQQLSELQTLTDVVTGKTENKLSLERYVLQAYFRDVLLAANTQLGRLTNGRYQFELATTDSGPGTRQTGLEVNVYDDNVGRTRSARTLSGGESFMAALALALALCQIIQEQSGGISIDALFIDEGFGSLDQQALEDALHVLQELEGQRMIGIISHVTELEDQVPDQLRITAVNGRSKVSYRCSE